MPGGHPKLPGAGCNGYLLCSLLNGGCNQSLELPIGGGCSGYFEVSGACRCGLCLPSSFGGTCGCGGYIELPLDGGFSGCQEALPDGTRCDG